MVDFDREAMERAEMRFRGDIWRSAPEIAMVEAGVLARRFGPVLATSFAQLGHVPGMNMVQGAAEPGAIEGGHLERAIAWMREWELDHLVPVTSGRPGSEAVEALLSEAGYEQGIVARKYAREVGEPSWRRDAPGVRVHLLKPGESEGMSSLITEAHQLPDASIFLFCAVPEMEGWRAYSAYLHGAESACGAMLITDGVAVLGLDATGPWARGHGCNRALLRHRLIAAEEAGCHTALAGACDANGRGSAAAYILEEAGFEPFATSVVWRPAHVPKRMRGYF